MIVLYSHQSQTLSSCHVQQRGRWPQKANISRRYVHQSLYFTTSIHLRSLNLYFSYYQVEEAKFMTMSACIYHFLTSAAMKPFHCSFSSCQRLLFIQPILSIFLSSCILFWVSYTIIPLGRISQHVLSLSSN